MIAANVEGPIADPSGAACLFVWFGRLTATLM